MTPVLPIDGRKWGQNGPLGRFLKRAKLFLRLKKEFGIRVSVRPEQKEVFVSFDCRAASILSGKRTAKAEPRECCLFCIDCAIRALNNSPIFIFG